MVRASGVKVLSYVLDLHFVFEVKGTFTLLSRLDLVGAGQLRDCHLVADFRLQDSGFR